MSAEIALAFLQASTQQRNESGSSMQFDTTALSQIRSVTAAPGCGKAVLHFTAAVANCGRTRPFTYTHLNLPTIKWGFISVGTLSLKKI